MTFRPQPKAVILVGFMGAGKSSVGRSLAMALGWAFEDLDDRIESKAERRVAEIFRDLGEAEFRRLELDALMEVLRELQDSSKKVIALGGGAFVQPSVAELIDAARIPTVFLDADAEELRERCRRQSREMGAERPLLGSRENFERLFQQRRPSYLRATLRLETSGKSIEQITMELAKTLALQAGKRGEKE